MISEIEIRLRADIARLQQDMTQARQAVGGALSKIESAAASAQGALSGLAIGAGAVSFVRFIKGTIDATDALNDLSDRTSVAVTDLAALDYAARMTGTTLDGVAGAVNKLSQNIGKDAEKFRALGITAEDPIEAFKQLADIFKSIQDPQQRAAFGATALGKSWQEVAPTLLAGSEGIEKLMQRGRELSNVTPAVAAEAGRFNDKLDELTFAVQGAGVSIAADLLPTLNQLLDGFTSTSNATEKATNDVSALTVAFQDVVVVAKAIGLTVETAGKLIAAAVGQVRAFGDAIFDLTSLNWEGFVSNMRQIPGVGRAFLDDTGHAVEAFAQWENGIRNAGKTAKATQDSLNLDEFMTQADSAVAAGAKAAQVAEFLKAEEIAAARKKAADAAVQAAEKEEKAYSDLINTIREKITVSRAELATTEPLTEAQKMGIKLDHDLASGKLFLSEAHEKEVRTTLIAMEAQERYAANAKKATEAADALAKEREAGAKAADAEADALERSVTEFGKTRQAINEVTLARLEEQLAQRASRGLTLDEIAELEKLVVAKRRAVAAGNQLEVLEQQKKATEEATRAQQDMWASIDRTAHDTFVSILDGGKGLAERLKDTLKNTFFDWLYQQTLRKWIINIDVATSGGGAAGLAQAATGGGGAVGALGSILGIGTGAMQTAGALLAGNIGIGSTLSAGFGAIGTGTLSGITAGLSSVVGTLGPIALGIAGAVKLLDKAFGRGPREVTATGIQGTFGAGGFAGTSFEEWMKKGGWFSSTKRGTDVKALGAEQQQAFASAFQGIQSATSQYAQALGLSADAINGYSKDIKLTLTQNQAENEKLIAELFGSIADEMASSLVPSLATLSIAGESTAETLARVATNYTALDSVLNALGMTFGAVGVDSLAARERLISLSGGIDALGKNATGFAQNFLTEAERLAPVQEAVTKSLAEMGLAWVDTREEFKAVVMGLDKTTEAGAKQFAQLLALQEAFTAVTAASGESAEVLNQRAALQKQLDQLYMSSLEKERAEIDASNLALFDLLQARKAEKAAAEEAAAAIEAAAEASAQAAKDLRSQLVEGLRSAVSESLAHITNLVTQQKTQEKAAFDEVLAGINAGVDRANVRIAKLRDLASALGGFTPGGQTAAQTAAARQVGAAQIAGALAIARASGVLPSADSLQFALSAVGGDISAQFATSEDYQRSQLRAANDINSLSKMATEQLTVEERTLKLLQEDKRAAESAYARQIAALDAILETAREQAETALNGNGLLDGIGKALPPALTTISGAIGELARVIDSLRTVTPPPATNVPGSTLDQARMIEQIYQDLLGRAADPGGLAFYLEALKSGITLEDIRRDIMNSPEFKAMQLTNTMQGSFAPQTQNGTMAQDTTAPLLAEMQLMNAQLSSLQAGVERTAANTSQSAASGAQLADQFNQVSGGGNALFTELAPGTTVKTT